MAERPKLSLKSDYVRSMDFSSYLYTPVNGNPSNMLNNTSPQKIDENIQSIVAATGTNTVLYNERKTTLEQIIKEALNVLSIEQIKNILENPQLINITSKNENILTQFKHCSELIKYNTDNVSSISDIYGVINTQKNSIKPTTTNKVNIEFNLLVNVIMEAKALPPQEGSTPFDIPILSDISRQLFDIYNNNTQTVANILILLNDIYNKTSELNILLNTETTKDSSIIQYYRNNILEVVYNQNNLTQYTDPFSGTDVHILAKDMSNMFIDKLNIFNGKIDNTNTISSLPNDNSVPYTPAIKEALSTLKNTDVTKDLTLYDNLSVVEYQQNDKPYMYWLAKFTNKCARDILNLSYNIYINNLASFFLYKTLPDTVRYIISALLAPINTFIGLPHSFIKPPDVVSLDTLIKKAQSDKLNNNYLMYVNKKDANGEYYVIVSTQNTVGDMDTNAIVDETEITISDPVTNKDGIVTTVYTYTSKNGKEIKCNVEYLINKYNSEILPVVKKTITKEVEFNSGGYAINTKYIQTLTFSDNTTKTVQLNYYNEINNWSNPGDESTILDTVINTTTRINATIIKTTSIQTIEDKKTYIQKIIYYPVVTTTIYSLYKITNGGNLKKYNEETLEFDEKYDNSDVKYKLLELAPFMTRKFIIDIFIEDYNAFLNNYFNNTTTEEEYNSLLSGCSYLEIRRALITRYNIITGNLNIDAPTDTNVFESKAPESSYFGSRLKRTGINIRDAFDNLITTSRDITNFFLLTFRDTVTEKSVITRYINTITDNTTKILNATWFLPSVSQFSIPLLDTLIILFRSIQLLIRIPLESAIITLYFIFIFLFHLLSPSAIVLVLIRNIFLVILAELYYKLLYDDNNSGYPMYWYGFLPLLNNAWCLLSTVFYTLSLAKYPVIRTASFLFYRIQQLGNTLSGLLKNTLVLSAIKDQIPKSPDGLVVSLIYY
jgi:hypothetical protein